LDGGEHLPLDDSRLRVSVHAGQDQGRLQNTNGMIEETRLGHHLSDFDVTSDPHRVAFNVVRPSRVVDVEHRVIFDQRAVRVAVPSVLTSQETGDP
jgi:hypothetical protein